MATSKEKMELSEEERAEKEVNHLFLMNPIPEDGSSSEEEAADPYSADGQGMDDELHGIVKHATDITVSIKHAIKTCSEIEDEQKRLSLFESALKEDGFEIDTIGRTINAADLALNTSRLCNTEPLQKKLRARRNEIEPFIELKEKLRTQKKDGGGFLSSIHFPSLLPDSPPKSRETISIPFFPQSDSAPSAESDASHGALNGNPSSEENRSKETDTSSSPSLNPIFTSTVVAFFGEHLSALLTNIGSFPANHSTACKIACAVAITTLVVGVAVGITAATCGIVPAALVIVGAIAAHAAIAEGVLALGALVAAGFFGKKCAQKKLKEDEQKSLRNSNSLTG